MQKFKKILLLGLGLHQVILVAQTGIYTVNGHLTMSGAVTTEIQLVNSTGPGIGHDQVNVMGNLTLAGPLTILRDGYTPNLMHLFEICSYSGTLGGTFSSIDWPSGMTTGWAIDYGVLRPGKVTIFGSQSPLPVILIDFKGEATRDGNEILWRTASEINSDYFSIEYSVDGSKFREVGQVKAGGNSTGVKSYIYHHEGVKDGISYYRLKQVDYDGKTHYSFTISISTIDEQESILLYPNPTLGVLYFTTAIDDVLIYDYTGQIVLEAQNVGNSIDMSHLTSGSYYISINHATKKEKITLNK